MRHLKISRFHRKDDLLCITAALIMTVEATINPAIGSEVGAVEVQAVSAGVGVVDRRRWPVVCGAPSAS
jgi:hypothetical protein